MKYSRIQKAVLALTVLSVTVLSPVTAVYSQETDNSTIEQGVSEKTKTQAPEITLPQGLRGTAGQTLSGILLPNGWTWTDGNAVLAEKQKDYPARYAVEDDTYDYSRTEGYHAEGHYVERAVPVDVTGTAANTAIHTPVLRADQIQM